MPATTGIEAVFLTTRNWGRSVTFFRSLGFELEFETDHASGQLRAGAGPHLSIAEVPDDALELDPSIEVVSPFEDTHLAPRWS